MHYRHLLHPRAIWRMVYCESPCHCSSNGRVGWRCLWALLPGHAATSIFVILCASQGDRGLRAFDNRH